MPSPEETLKAVFGFRAFLEGQEPVIRRVLSGKSVLAVFPTGAGKSLCYQLSALHLDGLTVVVSPLIALMKDQIDFLQGKGVAAARLDSSLSSEEYQAIDSDLRAGKLKLLYVAPERLSNERFVAKLERLKISLMVVDEAHCMSEWGHNFRPDYLKLAQLAHSLQVERVLALTATATPSVAADICRAFGIGPQDHIHTGYYRPNLELRVTSCPTEDRMVLLRDRLRSRPTGSTIVYVTLQATAEDVAAYLAAEGFSAQAYHAGMRSEDRAAAQEAFMEAPDAIVVATIAFGMGIDKSNIRYVYHYNLPKSLENYSQEIGRAGRDGNPAVCEILASPDDVIVLKNFSHGDAPDDRALASMVRALLQHEGTFDVSTYDLAQAHDMRPLVVDTLLTYLELEGAIEATGAFYSSYQFVPNKPSSEILSRFDSERAEFLKKVFACATKAKKWFNIDLNKTSARLGTTRDRLVRAFTFLEEQGDLTLKVAGFRQGYRRITPQAGESRQSPNTEDLIQLLIERFATRHRNDIARVQQVVAFTEENGCLVRHLLKHFGEERACDCGHCDRCLGSAGKSPGLRRNDTTITVAIPPRFHELRAAHPEALETARQSARFLCGLSSPRATRAKLNRHPLYGALAELPFEKVMAATETL